MQMPYVLSMEWPRTSSAISHQADIRQGLVLELGSLQGWLGGSYVRRKWVSA